MIAQPLEAFYLRLGSDAVRSAKVMFGRANGCVTCPVTAKHYMAVLHTGNTKLASLTYVRVLVWLSRYRYRHLGNSACRTARAFVYGV